MLRLTSRVFTDLAIWMIGFGLVIGLVFPPFVTLLGVPREVALTPWFFVTCMAAGFLVGAVNIGLAKVVVGSRLRLLADRMRRVEAIITETVRDGEADGCTPETCRIEVDSQDEIGESAQAFNHLVNALALSRQTEIAVRRFSNVLGSQLELDHLVGPALAELMEHTQANAGAILVEEVGQLKVAVASGIKSPETLVNSASVRDALRTETRQRVSLPEGIALESVLTNFRPRDVVVDPILNKHVPLGAIVLASASIFDDPLLARLDLFRQGLALALNNALTHDRMQRLAALDPLTCTFNRRFGLERLREEYGRSVRSSVSLGIMMLDVDHFKVVNDTYGHLIGDRALVHIAQMTHSVLREGDVLVRYGGDEFLAILPAAVKQDAALIAERVRKMIDENLLHDGDLSLHLTASFGVTAYPEAESAGEADLLNLADTALCVAKEGGRNRVVIG